MPELEQLLHEKNCVAIEQEESTVDTREESAVLCSYSTEPCTIRNQMLLRFCLRSKVRTFIKSGTRLIQFSSQNKFV
jgi:hypothetical protein